jgi:hypothetical protein
MSGKTDLPADIDTLSKDDIVRLLKRVADERDEAVLQLESTSSSGKGKKRQKTVPVSVPTQQPQQLPQQLPPPVGGYATLGAVYGVPVTYAPPPQQTIAVTPAAAAVSTGFDVPGTKKRILKNATQRIKKTVHTDRNKPYTEVLECVPTEAAVLSLMEGFEPKSHRHPMIKWQLTEDEVIDWLNMHDSPRIHPVTSKINTICLFGEKPNLYVHAKIESLEIKWERKSGAFSMRFRTMVAGYGVPPNYSAAK